LKKKEIDDEGEFIKLENAIRANHYAEGAYQIEDAPNIIEGNKVTETQSAALNLCLIEEKIAEAFSECTDIEQLEIFLSFQKIFETT